MGDTNESMSKRDRAEVVQVGGPMLTLRLAEVEASALEVLVDLQRQETAHLGLRGASRASVLRSLLRREAQARGVWPRAAAAARGGR